MNNHKNGFAILTLVSAASLLYSLFTPIACYITSGYESWDLNAFSVFGPHANYWLNFRGIIIAFLILSIIVIIGALITGIAQLVNKELSPTLTKIGAVFQGLTLFCTFAFFVTAIVCILRGTSYLTWSEIGFVNCIVDMIIYMSFMSKNKRNGVDLRKY